MLKLPVCFLPCGYGGADELLEALHPDRFEDLSRELVRIIDERAHLAFYRARRMKAEAEQRHGSVDDKSA